MWLRPLHLSAEHGRMHRFVAWALAFAAFICETTCDNATVCWKVPPPRLPPPVSPALHSPYTCLHRSHLWFNLSLLLAGLEQMQNDARGDREAGSCPWCKAPTSPVLGDLRETWHFPHFPTGDLGDQPICVFFTFSPSFHSRNGTEMGMGR